MKSKSIKILLMGAAITSMLSSCGDSWFEREPKNILTNELVWNDPNMINRSWPIFIIVFRSCTVISIPVVCVKQTMRCIVVH